jgi:hypothetical protein
MYRGKFCDALRNPDQYTEEETTMGETQVFAKKSL